MVLLAGRAAFLGPDIASVQLEVVDAPVSIAGAVSVNVSFRSHSKRTKSLNPIGGAGAKLGFQWALALVAVGIRGSRPCPLWAAQLAESDFIGLFATGE